MYCNKFFKTEDEAKAFQKSQECQAEPHPGIVPGGSRNGCAGRLDARY